MKYMIAIYGSPRDHDLTVGRDGAALSAEEAAAVGEFATDLDD
ncbi:hypothetical protein ACSNOI_32300 [Actinomadura kijaniata]